MTKEETITYLKAYLNGDTAIGNIIPLRSVLESAVEYLEPSLPSNLGEAILNIDIPDDAYNSYEHQNIIDSCKKLREVAFKAGAEWMAGQGVNADFEVCKLANRAWLTPIDEKRFMQDVYGNFAAGDRAVVQIRKK